MRNLVRAPELEINGGLWLNTENPIRLKELQGKLIILDFFTSCCINCRHVAATLARLEAERPAVQVIGVHSPKFDAERHPAVAAAAVARLGIRHPTLHDPDRALMARYAARAWPTLVFVDPHGRIVGAASGEPDYGRLLETVDQLTAAFAADGALRDIPTLLTAPPPAPGRLRFPAKVKPLEHRPGLAVADAGAHQIAILAPDGREIGRYGSDAPGRCDGAASEAQFTAPEGLICVGHDLYVADTGDHMLRRIDLRTGGVTTLAGTGERGGRLGAETPGRACALASPADLALTPYGLAFANAGTHQLGLYRLEDGMIHVLAGGGHEDLIDGPAETAALAQPSGLCFCEQDGCLYWIDAETSSLRRLRFDGPPQVETLIGAGLFDWGAQDGPWAQAQLQHPQAITILAPGLLAIADSYNDAVRLVDLGRKRIDTLRLTPDPATNDDCAGGVCAPHAEPAGICALSPTELILAETNRHRLTRLQLSPDGLSARATAFA